MLKFLNARAGRFAQDKQGSAAVLFGLTLIPMLLIIGVAIDYGRALTVRSTVSDAADAAALAIGSWPGLSNAELETKAKQFFEANYASSLSKDIKSDFKVKVLDDDIIVTASASVPTTFMRLANFKTLDVGVQNTITKKQRNIELALVLDTTGSMASSGKMTALKKAANQMVGDLFGKKSTSDTVDVAVVPFAGAVNVGTGNKNANWLDTKAKSKVAQEDFGSGVKPFDFFKKLKSVRSSWDWQGCVREREGSAYELTDATPSKSKADSLFAPYFAPDEPDSDHDDGDTYYNSYIDDGNCGEKKKKKKRTPAKCQAYTAKYNSPKKTSSSNGPNKQCPPRAITALSNKKSTVESAINALQPDGYTNIPAGLLWGWRVLSPGAPFTEGEAYDEEERVKAIVLLTDGSNNAGQVNNHNGNRYNAFGYAANGHLGSKSGSQANSTLNSKTATVCSNIKAKGIKIYTIGFRVTSSTTQNLLKNCATKPDMYYNSPSNAELSKVFAEIAQGLSELRIAQ